MCENEKKCTCKCMKCQFYEEKTDFCTIKNVTEYTKNDVENCKDFLIKEKLIHHIIDRILNQIFQKNYDYNKYLCVYLM